MSQSATPAPTNIPYLGIPEQNPRDTFYRKRAPTIKDFSIYRVGDRWINRPAQTAYILVSKANGVATWVLMSAGGGPVLTINGFPSIANNFNFTNTGGLSITGGAGVFSAGVSVASPVVKIVANQITVQTSSASAVSNPLLNGVAHFDSTEFNVDANGFVTLVGSAVAETFTVDAFTAPGTNPVTPDGAGNVTVHGTAVAAHSIPLRTNSIAANSYQIEVQRAASSAATDATSQGVASFNSAEFSVDANGFVSLIPGPGAVDITPNTGVHVTNATFSLLATSVAASGFPARTNGTAANSMQVEIQRADDFGVSSAANAGLASFSNTNFAVDANGFVTLLNGVPASSFPVQAASAPGTNPVLPTAGGAVTINGTIVAAHSIPIRSDSLAANTINIEVQRAAATVATDATSQGMASFNSAQFSVDANGFVSELNGLPVTKVAVQASSAPGTNPVVPSAAGTMTVSGSIVAAHAIPLRTDSLAVNAYNIEAQFASAQGASSGANAGMASFNSVQFSVDANGWVSAIPGAGSIDITPDTGVHVTNSTYTFSATTTAASGVPISTNGVAANSLQVLAQRSSASAATNTTAQGLASFNSAQFTVDANGWVSSISGTAPWLDSAGGALVNHDGYFATAAAVYTLPAGVANGDMVEIVDFVSGGVVVTAQGGDLIRISNTSSSVNGTATSTQLGDALRLVYRLVGQVWVCVPGAAGNWILA